MSDVKVGRLIDEGEQRDAIHIAIAPVVATCTLAPGAHIGFTVPGDRERVGWSANPIGIVDPFLTSYVQPGQRFWMCLYPQTITSLRHDWTHPAYAGVGAPTETVDAKQVSERWLRVFADKIGLSYSATLDAIRAFDKHGDYHIFGYDTPDAVWSEREEMWRHYESVTGESVDEATKGSVPFSCAC